MIPCETHDAWTLDMMSFWPFWAMLKSLFWQGKWVFFSESHDWFMIDSWLVHDWFMIGLRISWDSPFPRYLYLDIRNQDSVSSGHLILWRSCEVQTKEKDDSSVVSFWLKFTLPSIIMGFSWKMGVSPIWVSFHLEPHFPLKQICFTETIPKFRENRWITDPNHLIMGVKGKSTSKQKLFLSPGRCSWFPKVLEFCQAGHRHVMEGDSKYLGRLAFQQFNI